MTTTTLPAGHVVCPRCSEYANEPKIGSKGRIKCYVCNDDGSIPDPRIATWHTSSDPRALLDLLGKDADEARLRMWDDACFATEFKLIGDFSHIRSFYGVATWASKNPIVQTPLATRAAFIRCIWPCPVGRERVECPECAYEIEQDLTTIERSIREHLHACQGSGTLPAPLVEARWLESNVVDLARVIRGTYPCCEAVKRFEYADGKLLQGKCPIHGDTFPPNLDPFGYSLLADALEDAGCSSEEVMRHARAGVHVAGGCWLINELNKGTNAANI